MRLQHGRPGIIVPDELTAQRGEISNERRQHENQARNPATVPGLAKGRREIKRWRGFVWRGCGRFFARATVRIIVVKIAQLHCHQTKSTNEPVQACNSAADFVFRRLNYLLENRVKRRTNAEEDLFNRREKISILISSIWNRLLEKTGRGCGVIVQVVCTHDAIGKLHDIC
jgi:hypothetical protein